jgi:hypothetical protein
MSSPNPLPTAPYTVQLTVTSLPLPSGNSAQASISVVVTDTTGTVQAPVLLVGTETPPWSFTAQLTPSSSAQGSLTATALDTNGATIGTVLSGSFSIPPAATFNSPSGFTVTPVTTTTSAAAAHVAAARGA